MATRRRVIVPEIWEDPKLEKISRHTRLHLIGLISNACDYGRFPANYSWMRNKIYAYEDVALKEIEKMTQELTTLKEPVIIRYASDDSRDYYFFPKWFKNQRIDRPTKSPYPQPAEDDNPLVKMYLDDCKSNPPHIYKNYSKNQAENEAKNQTYLSKEKLSKEELSKVKEVILYLNECTDKEFKASSESNIGYVYALLKEGYSVDDFKKVIDNCCFLWFEDSKMNQYLRPSTLFNPDKFEGYLNDKGAEKEREVRCQELMRCGIIKRDEK